MPLIEKFLQAYPKTLIQQRLTDIYLLGALSCYGKSYGGTCDGTSMYVVDHGRANNLRNKNISIKFAHHEFSHILYAAYPFPSMEWTAINDAKFKYIGSGTDLLGKRKAYEQTDELLAQGSFRAIRKPALMKI